MYKLRNRFKRNIIRSSLFRGNPKECLLYNRLCYRGNLYFSRGKMKPAYFRSLRGARGHVLLAFHHCTHFFPISISPIVQTQYHYHIRRVRGFINCAAVQAQTQRTYTPQIVCKRFRKKSQRSRCYKVRINVYV